MTIRRIVDRLPAAGPIVSAALFGAVLLLAAAKPASTQSSMAGLWGSPLYRVEINAAGSTVTGTFTPLADQSAVAGTISGKIGGDGKVLAARWTQLVGGDSITFTTSLRLSADGSLLSGYRFSASGQPASFSLHRAVNGQVPMPIGPDELAKNTATSRPASERPATTVTPAPGTTPAPATTPAALGALRFDSPAASVLLAREYDHDRFDIRLRVTWTQPGSILDMVGIAGAPVGSFCVLVDAEGLITLQVYAPSRQSAMRNASGWHLLVNPVRTKPGESVDITVNHTPQLWQLSVATAGGARRTIALGLPVPASGQPLFLGDFPGDNNFAASYHPLRGFVGSAELMSFVGKVR
jgi:hypothetical protein